MTRTVHAAVYDSLADWETGYLLVELRTGRFTGEPWRVLTVAEAGPDGLGPITTMGGLRILPDMALDALDPRDSDLLVLAGADFWDAGGGAAWVQTACRFLDAGVPVAAICGATAGLAGAGLLDERDHTSAAADYLAAIPGYAGSHRYAEARAVIGGDLITAGPDAPVQFACAVLGRLGLASAETLRAYEGVFHDGDASAFPALMQAAHGMQSHGRQSPGEA